ncbi:MULTISPECIES: sensor histidine kinase [unclassified Modestobacter]|uniref:sensor histidine kinase n=1 Tax=unclassified Modestobacter TaxID=2643866 RepID=UPI0022AAEDA2|nr:MULTISPECIES: ATP-binding protein [unclassified Modestobacter]MCZ2824578.1 histidine kinase [Modestobacter sp. VKM Ac-2981]MCZ2853894.1 histidine kinase [Modestobacter sp. VKM Ac-2982]
MTAPEDAGRVTDADARLDAAIADTVLADAAVVAPRLSADPARAEQLHGRLLAVLRVTHARVRGVPPAAAPTAQVDVGAARARTGLHPAESLRVASLLFQRALPALVVHHRDDAAPGAPSATEQVALMLHQVIDELVIPASISYVDVLLARISDANRDERRRVARDLHDHTSHGIGAAMQGIDLALHLHASGQPLDVERLRTTRQLLLDTLNDVRGMATRLRDMVGDRTLGQALQEYLDFTAPVGLEVTLAEDGEDVAPLPGHVKEESYLIVREAIRNSFLHGRRATRLDVAVRVADGQLTATVADDGSGFDPAAVDATRSVGLSSVRERAEGLGGSVALDTGPGGVRLVLTVPAPGTST